MAGVREVRVEDYFVQMAVQYRCKAPKLVAGDGLRGWPDRMLLWPVGIVDYVELKRPEGGKFEPLQERTHYELRKMGFRVEVLNTNEKVRLYFQQRAATLGVAPLPKSSKSTGVPCATDFVKSLNQRKPR